MNKILSAVFFTAMLTSACTKQSHGSDDPAPHHQGVDDNLNGGGGNNVISVPPAVLSTFNARYPDATTVEWKKQSDGNYKAEFYRGSIKWQAIFTPAGVLVKEEHK